MRIDFKTMIERIKASVREIDPEARIYLYGSRVRGTAREDSDWDVLILVDKDKVSLRVYSLKEWFSKYMMTPLFFNVQRDGVLL